MQFESRIKRSLWINACLGLVPDTAIGFAAAYLTSSGLLGVVGTVFGLQLIYFVIWLKNSLWQWFVFWAGGRKRLASYLFVGLRKNRYPQPDDYISGADGYFSALANDPHLPCEDRVKAAIELAGLTYPAKFGLGQFSLRLHLAYEDALDRYKRTFEPARRQRTRRV